MQRQTKANKNINISNNDKNNNSSENNIAETNEVLKLDLSSDPVKDYIVTAGLILAGTAMGIYYYYHGVPFAPEAELWQRNGVIATVVVLYLCAVVYTIDREVETCTFDKRRNTMQLSRQVSRVHQPQSYVHQLTDLHRVDVESIKNNKFHRVVVSFRDGIDMPVSRRYFKSKTAQEHIAQQIRTFFNLNK
jgi:hypothetical protein